MAQKYRGQVAVITGGSAGIGHGIAEALAREGCRLVLGARRKEELEVAAAALRRGGREARAIPCDVTIPQQAQRLCAAAIDRWDRLDILVANAGIGLGGEFMDTAREDLRQVFDVNVHGVINTLKAGLPKMVEQGSGAVVLVSSVLGFRGVPSYGGYCATKHAVNGLAESLRTELEPKGIHVLLACPGLTDTSFHERRLGKPGASIPRDRAQSPTEAGQQIVDALKRRKKRVTLTRGGRFLASLSRHAPGLADRMIDRWYRKQTAAPAAGSASDADGATG